jgi:20S proteasome subunit alpha 3
VEYAREAAMHGGTVLAVKGKDSVVLFSYTKSMISKIVSSRKGGSESVTVSCEDPKDEDEGPQKLRKIHNNLYVIGSGISADVSHCIRHAFLLAMKHQSTFNSDMPVRRLVTAVGESFHQRTLYPGLRPFGCSLLLIGKSQQQPERTAVTGMVDNNSIQHLFEIDSFGNVFDCDLTCIGMSRVLSMLQPECNN